MKPDKFSGRTNWSIYNIKSLSKLAILLLSWDSEIPSQKEEEETWLRVGALKMSFLFPQLFFEVISLSLFLLLISYWYIAN